MSFFKLIRYKNLLFIILTQYLLRYALCIPLGADLILNDIYFFLLVFATICIAAAGYVINDIYDVTIDHINRPKKVIVGKSISEKNANYLFIILNIIGVGIGFLVANEIKKPEFSGFFIVCSALLYLYASFIKTIPLIGNLIVSGLVAFSLIIVSVFDLLPAINFLNIEHQSSIFKIIVNYSFFAFYINLLREIVKDIEDVDGDKNGGLNTLPILLGRKRASYLVFGLSILALFAIIYYNYMYLYNYTYAVIYSLLFILAPLLFFSVKVWDASKKGEFTFLSKILKLVMFLGICSLLLFALV